MQPACPKCPLVKETSEKMRTRQKEKEQEQKRRKQQEEEEAEAEEYLDERRAVDGQERFWSLESPVRLRVLAAEEAIKNSPKGQVWNKRYVVEAKAELERREQVKHNIAQLSNQVSSGLNLNEPLKSTEEDEDGDDSVEDDETSNEEELEVLKEEAEAAFNGFLSWLREGSADYHTSTVEELELEISAEDDEDGDDQDETDETSNEEELEVLKEEAEAAFNGFLSWLREGSAVLPHF